ncbi:MAG TPA: hypothetical protein VEX64_01120, partial [Pyrinomonadaceae bacterium]|nr:hypothetical protein [Pyrinomonadaceae bacterium]
MFRTIPRALLVLVLSSSVFAQTTPTAGQSLLGFNQANSRLQRQLEARFDASLRRENLREWMRRLSARPHHVGSAYGKEN